MAPPDTVVVHPLVLLSIVDHYNRVARDTKKRVIGMLLGEASRGRVDVTNSFAIPFEEDDRDPAIWFLDHNYLEHMFGMFRKVNAREKVVGWYSTGTKLRAADLDIHAVLGGYTETPLLVTCEVAARERGLPVAAYYAKDEIREDGTQKSQKVFSNIPTEVGATEAEEIGVEHLLRDVRDANVSTLAGEVAALAGGLRGLRTRLAQVQAYLKAVLDGRLPMNPTILYQLQDVFNLLPNLGAEDLGHSFAVQTNDMMLAVYAAALTRAVLALHTLIDNKEHRAAREKAGGQANGAGGRDAADKDKGKKGADPSPPGEAEDASKGPKAGGGGGGSASNGVLENGDLPDAAEGHGGGKGGGGAGSSGGGKQRGALWSGAGDGRTVRAGKC